MPKAKPKKNGVEASFERYARAIQGDIARLGRSMETGFKSMREGIVSIRADMATREGIHQVRDEMATHKHLLEVRDDVQRLNGIMVSKADLAEVIRREFEAAPYAKETEVNELRVRMLRIEEELDINQNHRAA